MRDRLIAAALTHPGYVRQNNEDHFAVVELADGYPLICIVADGMGGHQNGELASSLAVSYCRERLVKDLSAQNDPDQIRSLLNDTVQKANVKVYLASLETTKNTGMGTTLTLAVFYPESVYVCHIGDSRCYLLRNHILDSVTSDHTVAQEMVEAGSITYAESLTHPHRHVLTQALGTPEYLKPFTAHLDLLRGDRLVLCSDGLHGYVSDADIERVLSGVQDPQAICEELIDLALQTGGKDNITVVAVIND